MPEGMRLDAATYHGNRVLRFSDNEDDDNYDQMREEQIGKQQAMSRSVFNIVWNKNQYVNCNVAIYFCLDLILVFVF